MSGQKKEELLKIEDLVVEYDTEVCSGAKAQKQKRK